MIRILFIALGLSTYTFAIAGELDAYESVAVDKTVHMLTNADVREQAMTQHKGARAIDQQVKSLAITEENTDKVYELSAKVFERIAHETDGDVSKLHALITDAQSDPEGFASLFSADEKQMLSDIAASIEASQ